MIIGISGKISSGKDTLANIICYLAWTDYMGVKVPPFTQLLNGIPYIGTWKVKKFANKLKATVCMLTGCGMGYLEDQKLKNELLDDEWQIYEIFHWEKPTNLNFGTEKEAINHCKERNNSQHHYEYKKSERTYRWLLQTLGTEAGRNIIHQNIWINALFSDYESRYLVENTPDRYSELRNSLLYNKETTLYESKWIITDVRFPNEAEAIKKRGGVLIRINRDFINTTQSTDRELIQNKHSSEVALDNYVFDYSVDNNGTIEELVEKIKPIYNDLGKDSR